MTVEMKKYKLGDLIDVSRGKSLAGEFYATSGNLVRLTMGNFDYINNCFKQNTSKDNLFFSGKVEEKFILNAGDIITPLTEQTPGLLGSTARIPESGKYIQSQDVALVRCKKDKLDDGFAYYLISSESVKKQLGAAAQQTKIRHTSPDKIKDCTVYIPEISIQKKIGNVLSTLDKRIENLRAQNRVLEQTAKTIYDYTFLQCAGHQTTYNKTLNRNIPADWEVKKLGDLCSIFTGKKDVSKRIPGDYAFFSCAPEKLSSNEYLYDGQAILVSGNGSYTGRVSYYDGKFDLYQRTYACVLKNTSASVMPYLYFTMKYLFEPAYSGGTHGSAIPYIVMNDLTNYSICWNSPAIESFVQRVSPMFKKRLINLKQIEALITQRNTLLPLLMTGQIEV